MNTSKTHGLVSLFIVGLLTNPALPISIETVVVGNPGNAADTRYETPGYGSVGYTYNIGKYEVTAGQYTEFLNAVAKTDTYGLYNPNMDTANTATQISIFGCNIKRTGTAGSYSYSIGADWANRPVNFVSWGDAARFANWMHNGQPSGMQNHSTTESGSYALNGASSNSDLLAIRRNATATWVIPDENEWYKAAYHKNDGVTGNYFDYPTSSNTMPSNALGNPTDPGNNATYIVWNGDQYVYTIDNPYYRTEVGSHENSGSPYDTFDQGGNVYEFNETVLVRSLDVYHGTRGGSFSSSSFMQASLRNHCVSTYEFEYYGFRVALVPEPTSILLLAFGILPVLRRRPW